MSWEIRQGDALERLREMPDESVQCCVTSPPYWGLRDYGVDGQLGLEQTPEQFVAKMVEVFAEVRRVLRVDGTCWVNIGDSYARSAGHRNGNFGRAPQAPAFRDTRKTPGGHKDKDLAGVPWRLALALCEDGWYLRSDTIEEVELYCPCGCGHVMEERIWRHSPDREVLWNKPNPMPESVTDRPTRSHEYLFLLSKAPRYFYDAEAIREPDKGRDHARQVLSGQPSLEPSNGVASPHRGLRTPAGRDGLGRNKRSVWTIATRPYPDAHFATFPPDLVEPCILAGTPPKVCGECGAPYTRVVEKHLVPTLKAAKTFVVDDRDAGADSNDQGSNRQKDGHKPGWRRADVTLGWQPSCDHDDDSGRAVVLDPFAGAGTTNLVATKLSRDSIGIELNPAYAEMAADRIRRWEANPAGHLKSGRASVSASQDTLDLFSDLPQVEEEVAS